VIVVIAHNGDEPPKDWLPYYITIATEYEASFLCWKERPVVPLVNRSMVTAFLWLERWFERNIKHILQTKSICILNSLVNKGEFPCTVHKRARSSDCCAADHCLLPVFGFTCQSG